MIFFHRFLIGTAILFSMGFAVWAFMQFRADGGTTAARARHHLRGDRDRTRCLPQEPEPLSPSMNHDALEAGMFWAGALMALTPLVFAGVVIGVWWFQRRKAKKSGLRLERDEP